LSAKVKFSEKFPNYKLDAVASVSFACNYIVRDVKQQLFAKTTISFVYLII